MTGKQIAYASALTIGGYALLSSWRPITFPWKDFKFLPFYNPAFNKNPNIYALLALGLASAYIAKEKF